MDFMNDMCRVLVVCYFLFVSFANISVGSEPEGIPVWTPVPKVAKAQLLFIGFQESLFVRKNLGEWLPKTLLKVSDKDEIYYSVSKILREGAKMSIELVLWNATTDDSNVLSWQWTLPTNVSKVIVVAGKPGEIEVMYQETGEVRIIALSNISTIIAAKEKFSISRSAPMWEWRVHNW